MPFTLQRKVAGTEVKVNKQVLTEKERKELIESVQHDMRHHQAQSALNTEEIQRLEQENFRLNQSITSLKAFLARLRNAEEAEQATWSRH